MTLPEQGAAPNDVIMPQKLTLKQPHSGKGSFTVKKEGQVAYGFALEGATVTLELSPNAPDGYSIDNSLIKVYKTNDSNKAAITLSGTESPFTFTMPNAPVTIEVEFMKTLTIIPDAGQVVYKDEEITNYHPTYTKEGITEADGNVVFTGNLKVGDNNKIVNDNLKAVNYTLEVKEGVTVKKLTNNAQDAVATLNGSQEITNDWHPSGPVTVTPPSGFLIKQTSFSSASLSLRDATAGDKYIDKLVFTEEGEHTVGYSLKRIGMVETVYEGKSITYKLDTKAPSHDVSVSNRTATVTLIDQASGLASCTYIWDGGTEQSVTGFNPGDKEATFTLTGYAGTHTLKLTIKDMAGNVLSISDVPVELEDPYIPPINPEPDDGDDDGDDNGEPEPDPDPIDPVANEAIQAPALGIYVENGKLCLEASQPCRVSIYKYQGSVVMIRQIPSGKTRLYELPAGQYIVVLQSIHDSDVRLRQKVMVR